ncbi:MAG: methionyl-tRNA formyltransferase, partial [Deltaproteobacteria bacterium]|nr:methionyl-tRNA formyltransferase [Deltaproteobacteria bacterium]
MSSARVIFMGSPAFAVPSLTALCERPDLAHVVAVVTQPDKPVGRGHQLAPPAVKLAAQARGIPILQPRSLKDTDTQAQLRALAPDLMVVAAYGKILPQAVLDLPSRGAVNVHASLLPRYRGASPIAHAILQGDAQTGVSIMRMEAGLDTGPVYQRDAVRIDESDTCGTLTVKLAAVGAQALVAVL